MTPRSLWYGAACAAAAVVFLLAHRPLPAFLAEGLGLLFSWPWFYPPYHRFWM